MIRQRKRLTIVGPRDRLNILEVEQRPAPRECSRMRTRVPWHKPYAYFHETNESLSHEDIFKKRAPNCGGERDSARLGHAAPFFPGGRQRAGCHRTLPRKSQTVGLTEHPRQPEWPHVSFRENV